MTQNAGTIEFLASNINCQSFNQTSGTLLLGANSIFKIKGNFNQLGSFTNHGSVYVERDTVTNIKGGSLIVNGDLYLGSETTVDMLTLNGSFKQEISGSKVMVNKLIFDNVSSNGVLVSNTIICNANCEFGETFVRNADKITIKGV